MPIIDYRLIKYTCALDLVRQLDAYLEAGYHLRTTTGRLITTLDQAVNAILANQFPTSNDELLDLQPESIFREIQ